MDVLKEMVRNLAAIIILTSFLEMLLPNTKMKGYTRLILGFCNRNRTQSRPEFFGQRYGI